MSTDTGGAAVKSTFSSSGGTPWCSAAWAAALRTRFGNIAQQMPNQTPDSTTTISPQ